MVFVVPGEERVEDLHFTMIGEAEVADAPCGAFLHEVVEDAVVHVSGVECIHASSADGMQQVIVDIVYLQLAHGIVVHLDTCLAGLRLGREVRELRGNVVFTALVAAEGDTRTAFRESAAVGRAGVEVVHAVFDGVVNLPIDHLLVELSVFTLFGG